MWGEVLSVVYHVNAQGGITRLAGVRPTEFPQANITVIKPVKIPNKMVSRCYIFQVYLTISKLLRMKRFSKLHVKAG